MRIKRFIAAIAAAFMLLCCMPFTASAEGEWWSNDVWDEATLISLGAQLPDYNAAEARYEISTPEQLLYLSGNWKTGDSNGDGAPDAPCDGYYVLTQDIDMAPLMQNIGDAIASASGEKTEGYMPPIAAETDDAQDVGVRCPLFGTFDGQGHSVSNIRIEKKNDKYAGFFGNVGHDFAEGYVKDLALINIDVVCMASGGLLAGAVYGDVDNCVLIGTIDCAEKTAGGIAGKVKKNDNAYIGTVRNCFVYADITVRGEGNENGAAGGITSAQSDGGRIYNCYVGGSINVLGEGADCVGGVSGNLKGGQALENTVMLLSKIYVEDGKNVGLLCGDWSGETGSHLLNNWVWDGTQLTGNVCQTVPESAAYATADAGTLMSKSFYFDTLGWDAELWGWVGDDASGYPMLAKFTSADSQAMHMAGRIEGDLTVTAPVLRSTEPMTVSGYEGDSISVGCTLTLPEGVTASAVTLHYGADKGGEGFASVPMEAADAGYTAVFPESSEGVYYYFAEAETSAGSVTFPHDTSKPITLEIYSTASKLMPKQITLSPGQTFDSVGFAWTTTEGGLTAQLRYREAGGSEWTEQEVTEISETTIAGDRGTVYGYSVDISGLAPETAYEYMAVTSKDGEYYQSEIYSFTTLPESNGYSFMVISDLQGTAEENYVPFLHTMDTFVKDQLGGVDFIINVGDITEDGSSLAQWRYMYSVLSEHYASTLTAFAPGNHEGKGDINYTIFKAQTNLPGGIDDAMIGDTTCAFTVGDVCFVILNTEPYTGLDGADTRADMMAYYEAQKEWARTVYEASGCRWRILAGHAGLVQDDLDLSAAIEAMCDELNVDLFFNGHIHNYYRACARGGEAAETGVGTTFITTSPMGCKFDDYVPGVIDDKLQFQTGGSSDERQYFTYVTVEDDAITVTAYQLAAEGDASKAATFAEYTVIDGITLTTPLNELYASGTDTSDKPEQAEPAAEAGDEAGEEAAAPKEGMNGLVIWVLLGGVALLMVALIVIDRVRKR